MRNQAGFTLVELLLSIFIIGVLAGLSLPVYNTFAARNDLDIAGQQLASMFRRAQIYARGMQNNSDWSVEVQSTGAILFKGTVFASRDTTYDETISFPANVTVTGLAEVQFTRFSAAPNTTGTVTLTSTANDSRAIAINAKGMVDY